MNLTNRQTSDIAEYAVMVGLTFQQALNLALCFGVQDLRKKLTRGVSK